MARPAYSNLENDDMRERLEQRALLLFRESGANGVSLRKLASTMGVSHTLLYRYFDNKEALFTAIRITSIKKLYAMMLETDNENDALELRVRGAAYALISYGTRYPHEYRFVFASEQPNLDQNHALLKIRHQVFDHMVNMVNMVENSEDQQAARMGARVWVHLAWAMLHGMLILNDNQQLVEGCTFDELVESALDLLFARPDSRKDVLLNR